MIKNERQYRIAKVQAEKFEFALTKIEPVSSKKIHPILLKAQEDALRSQLDDLKKEIKEYEKLRAGNFNMGQLESLIKLPENLIKARIALGLTQKDLASRLGLKEQQIQRYESTNYRSVSLAKILDIIYTLGINPAIKTDFPNESLSIGNLINKLSDVGVSKDFLVKRIFPHHIAESFTSGQLNKIEKQKFDLLHLADILGNIFAWSLDELFGAAPLKISQEAIQTANFKVSSSAEGKKLSAYIVYAHYLALLLHQCTYGVQKVINPDPIQFSNEVIAKYGSINFENVLKYVWFLGIPVLPLNDSGAFHGACWREDFRNVIVLKQKTQSRARWLFDLLHELWHASQCPEKKSFSIIEAGPTSEERRESEEEQEASQFAGDVILSGQAENLVNKCIKQAHNRVEWLKSSVIKIAKQERVPVDSLANYMAFRLSLQNINWWGTAENLQEIDSNPWEISRDYLLEQVDFGKLNEVDRNILIKALSE